MENNKKKIIFLIVAVVLIITIVTTSSYAYFTAAVSGNSDAQNNVVKTGNVALEFDDGPEVYTENNMYPGDFVEKTFSVENKGDIETVYNIYFTNVFNTFVDKSDLVYELFSADGGRNMPETVVPSYDTYLASNISIGVGETHHYTLRITFKETNDNQDDNHNVIFESTIYISDEIEYTIPEISYLKQVENMTLNTKKGTATFLYDYDVYDYKSIMGFYDSSLKCNNAIYEIVNYKKNYLIADPVCEKVISAGDIAETDMYATQAHPQYGYYIYHEDDYLCQGEGCTKMYSAGDVIDHDIYGIRAFSVDNNYYNDIYTLEQCIYFNGSEDNCYIKFKANQEYKKEDTTIVDNITIDFGNNEKFIVTTDLLKDSVEQTKQAIEQRLFENNISDYNISNSETSVHFSKRYQGNSENSYTYCDFYLNTERIYCSTNNYCSYCSGLPYISINKSGTVNDVFKDYIS